MNADQPVLSADLVSDAIAHMNGDHSAAVLVYARGLAGLGWATSAQLVTLDATGMTLVASNGEHEETARIDFPVPVTDAGSLRTVLVELAGKARQVQSAEPLPGGG